MGFPVMENELKSNVFQCLRLCSSRHRGFDKGSGVLFTCKVVSGSTHGRGDGDREGTATSKECVYQVCYH